MLFDKLHIMLADDDADDRLFFKEALFELSLTTRLTSIPNGEDLMQLLRITKQLPDILFLDLNMPLKNGFDCLREIKTDKQLKQLPVIIFSTAFDDATADRVYNSGAHFYICKPADIADLQKVLIYAIALVTNSPNVQPPRHKFVISNSTVIAT